MTLNFKMAPENENISWGKVVNFDVLTILNLSGNLNLPLNKYVDIHSFFSRCPIVFLWSRGNKRTFIVASVTWRTNMEMPYGGQKWILMEIVWTGKSMILKDVKTIPFTSNEFGETAEKF